MNLIDGRVGRMVVVCPLVLEMAELVVVGALLGMILGVGFVSPPLPHVLNWVELLHYINI